MGLVFGEREGQDTLRKPWNNDRTGEGVCKNIKLDILAFTEKSLEKRTNGGASSDELEGCQASASQVNPVTEQRLAGWV